MLSMTIAISGWPLAGLGVTAFLLLAVLFVIAIRARAEDLPALLATLSRWLRWPC